MLPSLADADRKRLFRCAGTVCGIALLFSPLAGRSSIEVQGDRIIPLSVAAPVRPKPVSYDVRSFAAVRDPFVIEDSGTPSPAAAASASGAVVTAVISGVDARALIEERNVVRLIRPGDAVDGSAVVSIAGRGVRLANGRLLPLMGDRP
jgi:hypothetical protein